MGAMFYYKQACSIQSEVEIKKEVPKPESAQVLVADVYGCVFLSEWWCFCLCISLLASNAQDAL